MAELISSLEGRFRIGHRQGHLKLRFQTLLPIRARFSTCEGLTGANAVANKECAAIIQVVGAGSGNRFDIEQARYNKIIMMTDADVDGAHIPHSPAHAATVTYVHSSGFGHVYAAIPPLHRIALTGAHKDKKPSIPIPMTGWPGKLSELGANISPITMTFSATGLG